MLTADCNEFIGHHNDLVTSFHIDNIVLCIKEALQTEGEIKVMYVYSLVGVSLLLLLFIIIT